MVAECAASLAACVCVCVWGGGACVCARVPAGHVFTYAYRRCACVVCEPIPAPLLHRCQESWSWVAYPRPPAAPLQVRLAQ